LLYAFSYLGQNRVKCIGYGENCILVSILALVLFDEGHRSIGIVYETMFNPIPLPLLALIWTQVGENSLFVLMAYSQQVKYCLGEWKTGKRVVGKTKEGFTEDKWGPVYEAYVKDLKRWDAVMPEMTAKIRKGFYEKAR
jgi:hypothetical protein